jgi:hypothetical protein
VPVFGHDAFSFHVRLPFKGGARVAPKTAQKGAGPWTLRS